MAFGSASAAASRPKASRVFILSVYAQSFGLRFDTLWDLPPLYVQVIALAAANQ